MEGSLGGGYTVNFDLGRPLLVSGGSPGPKFRGVRVTYFEMGLTDLVPCLLGYMKRHKKWDYRLLLLKY